MTNSNIIYSKITVISLALLFVCVFFQAFESKFHELIKKDLIANFKRIFAPISNETVTTWSGREIRPKYFFQPESLEDIQDIIRNAKETGNKIRCIGQGHTSSSLSVTKDYLVDINNLNNVSEIKWTIEHGWTVTALAGTRINNIERALLENNPPLAFESMTYQNFFTASGVVAVGCHGAKTGGPSVSDLVVKLQIVTSDGTLKEFSNEKDAEEMNAARLNLGLFGIIYSVTFRVEPLFNLRAYDIILPLKGWLNPENIKQKFDNSDSLIIIYFPFNQGKADISNDEIRIKQFVRTQDPATSQNSTTTNNTIPNNSSAQAVPDILKNPELTPMLKGEQWKIVKNSIKNVTLIATEALHYRSDIETVQGHDVEFALKVDSDFTNVATEFSYFINKIGEYAEKGKFPINVYGLIRMIRASSALLSPVFDNDPNAIYCFLEFSSLKGTRDYPEFYEEITARWIKKYKTRPHWAKEWEPAPGIQKFLHEELGERLAKFEKSRAKYDPEKTFFDNKILQKVFYG
ncbi:10657_t:CDS:2 [Ambispora leptoticha]|uniref:D-arabinono-1,4-lactone oxidase n=1 Tax=Ambispora leptoticha TaxID=144679 RepID=A0A9N8ZDF7_9GLOM|nr:10657_t:CDS:2 [Ambispora leptoticha]